MSGAYFHAVPYGVNDDGIIDYDKVREIALECRPKLIVAGASAYARIIDLDVYKRQGLIRTVSPSILWR